MIKWECAYTSNYTTAPIINNFVTNIIFWCVPTLKHIPGPPMVDHTKAPKTFSTLIICLKLWIQGIGVCSMAGVEQRRLYCKTKVTQRMKAEERITWWSWNSICSILEWLQHQHLLFRAHKPNLSRQTWLNSFSIPGQL